MRSLRSTGSPLLLIHGGPGFGPDYFRNALSFFADSRQLFVCDQPAQQTGLEGDALQLADVLRSIPDSGPLQIITHSWGTLVLAAAAAHPGTRDIFRQRVEGGIFINPVPLTRKDFDVSYAEFVSRIPALERIKIQLSAALGADSNAIVDALWPYYHAPGNSPPRPDLHFELKTYRNRMRTLGNFDFSYEIDFLNRFHVILGQHDPTKASMLGGLLRSCRGFVTIEGVGHFPMLERPERWQREILELL